MSSNQYISYDEAMEFSEFNPRMPTAMVSPAIRLILKNVKNHVAVINEAPIANDLQTNDDGSIIVRNNGPNANDSSILMENNEVDENKNVDTQWETLNQLAIPVKNGILQSTLILQDEYDIFNHVTESREGEVPHGFESND